MSKNLAIIPTTRIDKFLWAARFYKTRSLATEDIARGRVKINGLVAKASREVRAGCVVDILRSGLICSFTVLQVSEQRGAAPLAQTLYLESAHSISVREHAQEQRRLHPEPALSIARGRPTKRQRRELDSARQSAPPWNARWSAGL